jgi:hypothetical protein
MIVPLKKVNAKTNKPINNRRTPFTSFLQKTSRILREDQNILLNQAPT